jgi:hypothetical protein
MILRKSRLCPSSRGEDKGEGFERNRLESILSFEQGGDLIRAVSCEFLRQT